MMFGSCVDRKRPRPSLVPPDLGEYTVEEEFKCKWGVMSDDRRRRDVPPPAWTSGRKTAAVLGCARDDVKGVGGMDPRPFESVMTEKGAIHLQRGPTMDASWVPSVAVLNAAPYVDTRRTAISDRYFR